MFPNKWLDKKGYIYIELIFFCLRLRCYFDNVYYIFLCIVKQISC